MNKSDLQPVTSDLGILGDLLEQSFDNSPIVEFEYTKKDGSIRRARGTQNIDYMDGWKPSPAGEFFTKAEGVIRYYDLDSKGWRCCRPESVVSIGSFE